MDEIKDAARRSPPTPRVTIHDFPEETRLEIAKQVQIECVIKSGIYKDIYNLCLVKPFVRVAREMLYSTVKLDKVDAATILWSVLSNPALAELIKEVQIHGYQQDVAPKHYHTKLIADHIRSLILDEKTEDALLWRLMGCANPRHGSYEVGMLRSAVCGMFLLRQCSALNSLLMHTQFSLVEDPDIGVLFELIPHLPSPTWSIVFPGPGLPLELRNTHSYGHLKSIMIDAGEAKAGAADLVPLFRLKALQELKVSYLGISDYPLDSDVIQLEEGVSGITNLRFDDSCVHPQHLATFIRCCRTLCDCMYWLEATWLEDDWNDFTPIAQALQAHTGSLRSLVIGKACYEASDAPIFTSQQLRNFSKLMTLDISANLLYQESQPWHALSTLLPLSLEWLRIDVVGGMPGALSTDLVSAEGLLSDMIGNSATVFPKLEWFALMVCSRNLPDHLQTSLQFSSELVGEFDSREMEYDLQWYRS